jgi:hypothetical protein
MKAIILILSMVLATSCSSDNSSENVFESSVLDFENISRGLILSSHEQNSTIITSLDDWQNLIQNMDDVGSFDFNGIVLSDLNVDFSISNVIAVYDLIRPHTGYEIIIESIMEQENEILVNFISTSGDSGYHALTQPFHIVKIPITNKPIHFELVE